ncbi:MAG: DUF971 domain-containing protein [Gemmatimonadota bacterium]
MADPAITPRTIEPTPDGARLAIEWEDGTRSEFAPRFLRQRCPCAGCVDEMTGIRTLDPESIPPTVYPTAIHYVGRYALQFIWSDGHDSGIYSFRLLRRFADEMEGAAKRGDEA